MNKVENIDRIKESKAETPPMEKTEEAKEKHLKMAKKQGDALKEALTEMTQNVAQKGGEKAAGHYMVGYAVEKPEGMYRVKGDGLEFQKPKDENIHIEISVRDGADGRFVPALNIQLTVWDDKGNMVGSNQQPFIWHPWLYHYGRNWKLPGSGKYTFHVHIDVPEFHRHDEKNGKRYDKPVDVIFKNIEIETKKPE